MSNYIPEQIAKAVMYEWNIVSGLENIIEFTELSHDWLVWKKRQDIVFGDACLVIPKNGKNWFFIPSSYTADDHNGIRWEYDITIDSCPKPNLEAARILAEHVGISTIDAFKILRTPSINIGVYHIFHPLRMIRELKVYNIKLSLVRPENRGGYQSDTVF